ncbi:MAG: small subunit ribosomal protein [Verrucomicrobiota bacterium]|jgi:ribosomal protein S6
MKRYEGLFILNNNLAATGKEDGVTVAIERISKDIEAAGGKIEATQKMDKRSFSRIADKKFSSGFYVNIIFQGPGASIATLQHKFGLNEDVFRVLFTIAADPKAAPALAAAK